MFDSLSYTQNYNGCHDRLHISYKYVLFPCEIVNFINLLPRLGGRVGGAGSIRRPGRGGRRDDSDEEDSKVNTMGSQ